MYYGASRISLYRGDSTLTVAAYATKVRAGLEPGCDVFFIDGSHTDPTVTKDFGNAIASMREGGVLMADDTTSHWPDVQAQWNAQVAAGHLRDAQCKVFAIKGSRGFCWARVHVEPR